MTFDNSLPHALPWNYPWLKDEIERRDEYIAQLEAELAHQKPQNHDSGAIEGESVKMPAEDETEAHSEFDSREKLEADVRRSLGFTVDDVFHWLDRQAAITANELNSESDAPKQTESGEIDTSKDDMRDFDDSREKLEADVRDEVGHFFAWEEKREQFANKIIGWLDRQEAITERHWMQINGANTSANIVLNKHIAELEAKVDELTAERDRYRVALGKAVDCADEIRRLS